MNNISVRNPIRLLGLNKGFFTFTQWHVSRELGQIEGIKIPKFSKSVAKILTDYF